MLESPEACGMGTPYRPLSTHRQWDHFILSFLQSYFHLYSLCSPCIQTDRQLPALYIRKETHTQTGLQISLGPRRAGQEGAMSHHDRQSGRQDVRKMPLVP